MSLGREARVGIILIDLDTISIFSAKWAVALPSYTYVDMNLVSIGMIRFRILIWLFAIAVFVIPSMGPKMVGHEMAPAERAMSVDCPSHAPPSGCPDEGTAKHAAGECCPLMAGVVALPSPSATVAAPAFRHVHVSPTSRTLAGRLFTKDPPPPRV